MLLHVVLFKFHDATTGDARAQLLDQLARLDQLCGGAEAGILHWQIAANLDTRKDYTAMEVALFASTEALDRFRRHPAHAAIAHELSLCSDWVVGDCDVGQGISPQA